MSNYSHPADYDEDVREFLDRVPTWIEDGTTVGQLVEAARHGCDSGVYMSAVTYWQAIETMSEHGDDVFGFIEQELGEIPNPTEAARQSWGHLAVFYVSTAVELFGNVVAVELEIEP